jgi:flagellar biosynthetic protein FliR
VIDLGPFVRLGLVLVRAGTLVMTVPILGSFNAPTTVKIGLTLLLSLTLAPLVTTPDGLTLAALTGTIAREFAIGLALSMAVRITIAGAEMGGHLAGIQLGFSYATIVDPASGARNQVMSSMYGMLATMALLVTNAHHTVLRSLVASYRILPIGGGGVGNDLVAASSRMLGLVMLFGMQLAAPVIVALLIVELSLGLLSRSAPALNIGTLGFGLRILVGFMVIAAAMAAVPTLSTIVLRQAFEAGDLALRALR